MAIEATCTWGDGPDILLSSKDWKIVNHSPTEDLDKWTHGTQKHWSTDLTRDEAVSLIFHLQSAVERVDELEHFAEMCNKDQKDVSDGEEF
ncbi:MAG TPA: hypothetical protein VMW36_07845 [Patescibacteria group bacterium]|nr:hypothetical protein [Patescibacteria group bacterium]